MNYHNPEQITEWGQSDGWRLLTTEEIKQPLPDDAEIRCADGRWAASGCRGAEGAGEVCTYRTKKPLPVSPLIAQLDAEIKALEEKKAVALAVEAGAEFEVLDERRGVVEWNPPLSALECYLNSTYYKVRLKPKPVTRPWNKPEDVPGPVCWLRSSGDKGSESLEAMVVAVSKRSMTVLTAVEQHIGWHESHKIQRMEYSTDRINWFKCETTEEAK